MRSPGSPASSPPTAAASSERSRPVEPGEAKGWLLLLGSGGFRVDGLCRGRLRRPLLIVELTHQLVGDVQGKRSVQDPAVGLFEDERHSLALRNAGDDRSHPREDRLHLVVLLLLDVRLLLFPALAEIE